MLKWLNDLWILLPLNSMEFFHCVFFSCYLACCFCCCLLWNLIDELCGVKHYIHVSNINSKSFFLKLLFPFFKYKTLCFFSYEFIVFNRWKNCLPKRIERRNNKKGWRKNKYWEKLFGTFYREKKGCIILIFLLYCRYNGIYIALWQQQHNKKIFVVEIEK